MAVVWTPYGFMTVRDPITEAGSSYRRTSRPPPPPPPTVKVSGNTVFINGVGYTISPSNQASFIQQRTGSAPSSNVQQTIDKNIQTQRQIQEQIQKQRLQPSEKQTTQQGVLIASEKKSPLVQRFQTKASRGDMLAKAGLTGLGLVNPFIRTGKAIASPIETTKSLYASAKDPIGTVKTIQESTATSFKFSPEFATGQLLGEVVLIKTPTIITKSSDTLRTIKLKEVPSERVIAPEYFKGQAYPAIKPGQTAGQLLKEFKSEGAGYTATSKPFAKETVALKGTSELPGVYQAPKVSPQFLRVGEGTKVFSLRPIATLRPSVVKTTPTKFKLTPMVKSTQKSLAPLKPTQEFFKRAPEGKSFIPFIKTEKEAIIPTGTKLIQTRKAEFFEFEGRKIPIQEFKTVPSSELKSKEIITTQQLKTRSSSGRIESKGIISPYEAVYISKSIPKSTSRLIKPSSSKSILRTSPYTSSYTPPSKISTSIKSPPSKVSKTSSKSTMFKGSSLAPKKSIIKTTTIKKPNMPFSKRTRTLFKKTKRTFKPPRRTPSLLAIGRGITSAKAGRAEFSGLTLRPIIKKRRKKIGQKKKR